jgi:hypothetical protein
MTTKIGCAGPVVGGLLLLSSLLFGACRSAPPVVAPAPAEDWVCAIVDSDPVFGGAVSFEQRLAFNPNLLPAGDPGARRLWFEGMRAELDAQAASLVREHATEGLACAAQAFFASDAGNALAAVETMTLGLFRYQHDSFPAIAAERLSDPDWVGPGAQAKLREVQQAMEQGDSHSPALVALVVAAGKLSAAEARASGAFYATDPGRQWLDVRTRVFPIVTERYTVFEKAAGARGFVRYRVDEQLEDLILPRAKFTESSGSER